MNQSRGFRRTMLRSFLHFDPVKSQRRQRRQSPRSCVGAGIQRLEERALLAGVPFQSFHSQNATGLPETGTHWEFDFADWNGDGTKDMFAINKQGASGTTEVSVLDGATGYQSFLEVELQTPLGHTDANWTFEVADWNSDGHLDLFAIDRDVHGTTGVTVVSGFEIPGTIPPTKPFTTYIGGVTPIPTV